MSLIQDLTKNRLQKMKVKDYKSELPASTLVVTQSTRDKGFKIKVSM